MRKARRGGVLFQLYVLRRYEPPRHGGANTASSLKFRVYLSRVCGSMLILTVFSEPSFLKAIEGNNDVGIRVALANLV